ncbi:peptidoglycan DD-metalloendopeptidase family protein [Arsenicicoccus sp. MKL-02]|uniref:Peptidoglycan DD-metalloendopeptidase family protein n=1 Tax=Arsenicicoccus cauae TaxID=2663847 RepID=A0A6I3IXC1_9MICO|nr:M23 family metallopeptidase [Arsenicicoccus cauae]MTB71556.1 peptidoglycan DD-metalloendopeptidase family protein [Arsenicicoccus cauae]
MRAITALTALTALTATTALTACAPPDPTPTPTRLEITVPGDTPPAARDLSADSPAASAPSTPSMTSAPSTASTATGSPSTTAVLPAGLDPANRFYDTDRSLHRSPWFAGAWPVMVPYGCTTAPSYRADPRCPGGQGFHHGTDVALPCGTVITAGHAGTVVDPAVPRRPGPAYGPLALRVRSADGTRDTLVGHARRLLVSPGQRVEPGTPLAEAGNLGAPDGCHLHLEVRAAGGAVETATDPSPVLRLVSASAPDGD